MKNKIFIFSMIIFLAVGFTLAKEAIAGASDNVYGWAWADTIGWISFNSTNCDSNGDGDPSDGPAQCTEPGRDYSINPIKDYGVNIDSSGDFSGYAWSSNIGWISFADFNGDGVINSSDKNIAGSPCTPNCEAKVDLASCPGNLCPVSGWARALAAPAAGANSGGWDGWIKLNDSNYQVAINSTLSPSEFEDWAWGSDVVGWVSFNRTNCDPDKNGESNGLGNCSPIGTAISNYKVMTDLSVSNLPPTAAISCNYPSCEVYETEILQLINDSTDPDGEMDIFQSIWSIDSDEKTSCSGKCNFTPQAWGVGIGNYTAKLYVEDTAVQSDTATKDFKIKKDITADFKCSLDNINWQTCEDINAVDGEPFYFLDDSLASEGASIDSRAWEKDASPPFDSDNNTNPSLIATIPSMTIKLTASDTATRSASKTHTIGVTLPLPDWREILPF